MDSSSCEKFQNRSKKECRLFLRSPSIQRDSDRRKFYNGVTHYMEDILLRQCTKKGRAVSI